MTDTGQVPGEGLPESAGTVEQPGAPVAHGTYTYLSETTAEDEDLLMPGTQGAWGNEVAPPMPEPVVETLHEPGPHEISGRDSGSVDLSGVRLPGPTTPTAPTTPIPPITPRRPLHLGPPTPDASASPVRSLADRGAVGTPVRQPGPAPVGPEYLDATVPQPAAPWGAPTPAQAEAPVPSSTEAAAAETVVPTEQPVGVAQAVVARVATEAGSVTGEVQEAGVPESGYDGQVPSSGEVAAVAAPVAEAVPGQDAVQGPVAAGAVEVTGDGAVPGSAGFVPAPEGDQVSPVDAPVPDGGEVPTAGTAAGDTPVSEPVPAAGPLLGGDGAQDAGQVPVAGEAPEGGAAIGQVPVGAEAVGVAEDVEVAEAVVSEEAHVAEVPVAEPGQVAPISEGDQLPEAPAAEAAQVVDAPVPQSEPLPEVSVPDVAQVSDAPAPEGVQVLDGAVPEAPAPVAEPLAPQAVSAPEATHPPEVVHFPEAAQAPEAAQFPEAAQVLVDVTPATPDAAQALQFEDAEHLAAVPQPDDAVAAPIDGALAAVAAEPLPQPTDLDQAAHPGEPVVPVEQSAQDPQQAQAPESLVPDVPLAPPQQPMQGGAPTEADAEAPVVAAAAVAQPSAPFPDAPQAPDMAAVPNPVEPQPVPAEVVAAETPEPPFVAEPAGPQLRAQAQAQPVQIAEDPARTPVEPTASGEGEAAVLSSGIPHEPVPDQPMGQFVQVEGSVPTTPHLAPTPPQPIVLPVAEGPGPVIMVPAPRDGGPELVQHADDLDTRAADQEDQEDQAEESTAVVEETRQPTGPAAPAYDDAEREAVLKVMRERRDIRNGFRSDPIPHEVLLRVLEAAHTAPSVGHSQPWDFVVIRSADTRRTMHELATRQREAYAKSLPKGRAKQFKELKIEAILDTPVNIVVTADPTRGGRHTLGRHTQPQMAPYSAALAVENLWLAARAEGLGVGWVSFFDEREMVRALGLPEHLEVIAYLCVGYVDEFPDEPELMQAGWSKRRPLSWVVHEETYGRRALPGEEPHDLLAETVAQIRPLDAKALGEAWERQKRMTKPAGALGMLEIISAQLSGLSRQCPPPIPEPAAVAIFAGDHGVHAQGVTPWPQEVTAQMVANFLGGGAVCNAFAGQVGAEVCVVDVGVAADLPATPGLLPRKVRAGTSDMTTGPAMTREEAKQAIEVGIETARDLVAAGNKALLTGEMGIANTTASAALISVFTGAEPAEVTGRGTGINDETLARKTEVVRRALEVHQPDPADPIGVLAAIGGFEHAALVGLLLGGASLRTPVILDGVSAGAAALVARAIAPEVLAACIAGHRSAEPGHVAALNKLGLRPLVDLDLRLGEGTGALLALPLVQSTARAMHEVATFDSAGVTEK
ncbi:nicotinate-nucleotide--dimethylbenzimidazole phosphoribosyltransferase [Streptomyces sp. uw30]|uniref:nicotinate-nucleotide--dimethylbenzimidazole phosphoribosyltransferase n=1 Tax=Streptomyces sp. uw30 TaxID=1828179 RepID=UPI0011CEC1B9|nr:nicotinate-nucleotide--dimethylbenzimidazole phosphoribosyltransferase [Streptomyces sp. uw30]TXS45900.1 nicotinate-nucleotide--dimethylbenzimidazole phosphoribosyltransferase [Streptomyces sp. uw30]